MAKPITQLYSPEFVQSPHPQALFINRDLSLVEFYRRVLNEGLDRSLPLLERVKFMAIFSSLIDEFFMVRVSGLKEKAGSMSEVSPDGLTAVDQFVSVRQSIREMSRLQERCMQEDILPALSASGIHILKYHDLSDTEMDAFRDYFGTRIHPVLTPQAVDPSHPFPYLSGGTLNIGLYIKPKLNRRIEQALHLNSDQIFVRMELPAFLPRFIPVDGREDTFVLIEDIVAANIGSLVKDAEVTHCHFFRICRDADIEFRESEAADLLEMMEENLRKRRFGTVVRLEVSSSMPGQMIEHLSSQLGLQDEDIYLVNGPLKVTDFFEIANLNRPELKYAPIRVTTPEIFTSGRSAFHLIRENDLMLHHPYMPYSIITDLIAEAAEDPDVLAIKMCLYRLGAESPIPPLLIKASEKGKQVTVLIELKARFDEGNNIGWAKKLEEAGVHVIYGLLGLKTHAKNTLIVRREGDTLKRYVHAATGNYNPQTSAAYTDLGLLTADDAIGQDVSDLFNFLTVYSQPASFNKLLVAPINLRERMLELIGRETENARNGIPARIVAKLNRLADAEIVQALYDASQAGVEIDLIVRGICTLRPGIPGVSDNIRVRSVVGRLLEHSRVYYFENGGNYEVYMGSSDWMPRNLDRRVEILTPVDRPSIREYLKNHYLATYLADNTKAWELRADGTYEKAAADEGELSRNGQEEFQGDLGLYPAETKVEDFDRLIS
ncbi:MAG TPA: polyphosphate kinase 1 [Pyrinomonadaceae bacterium]|nr:polyphosphate kinase 1 [Pyrinomonadaceae bacterium]